MSRIPQVHIRDSIRVQSRKQFIRICIAVIELINNIKVSVFADFKGCLNKQNFPPVFLDIVIEQTEGIDIFVDIVVSAQCGSQIAIGKGHNFPCRIDDMPSNEILITASLFRKKNIANQMVSRPFFDMILFCLDAPLYSCRNAKYPSDFVPHSKFLCLSERILLLPVNRYAA